MPEPLTINQLLDVDPIDMETEDVERLQVAVREAMTAIDRLWHHPACGSNKPGIMAGGVSTDVNVTPKAREVPNRCDCDKRLLVKWSGADEFLDIPRFLRRNDD